MHDVIVIGGGYAGMAAALQLGRARRRVLVVDGGRRRNRFARRSHGFLSRDGEDAAAIAAVAKDQLSAYRTIDWLDGDVVGVEASANGFRVEIAGGRGEEARRIVLATGVADRLPDIPGLAERWGSSVFHCPYCHGYELDQGRLGLIATSAMSMHMAMLLPDWGYLTVFLNDAVQPDNDQLAALGARGVTVERQRVDRVEGTVEVMLRGGRSVPLDGLFVTTRIEVGPIAEQLGCRIDDGPLGRTVNTDMFKATTVPGVYACGDAARPGGSLSMAVGDGSMAGAAAHQSLVFGLGDRQA